MTAAVLIALAAATLVTIGAFRTPDPGIELLKATVQDLDAGPPICLMSDCRSLERDVIACLMVGKARMRAEVPDCEPRRLKIRFADPSVVAPEPWPTRVGGPV